MLAAGGEGAVERTRPGLKSQASEQRSRKGPQGQGETKLSREGHSHSKEESVRASLSRRPLAGFPKVNLLFWDLREGVRLQAGDTKALSMGQNCERVKRE